MKSTQRTTRQIRRTGRRATPWHRQPATTQRFRGTPSVRPAIADSSLSNSGAPDVTDSLTVKVDASAEETRAALDRLDLAAPALRALRALGVADRAALPPTRLGAPDADVAFGLIWRLDGTFTAECPVPSGFGAFGSPGHLKVKWELRVKPSAAGGAYLSVSTRFEATDAPSRARLVEAWSLVGEVSGAFVRQAAAAVKADAEGELAESLAA